LYSRAGYGGTGAAVDLTPDAGSLALEQVIREVLEAPPPKGNEPRRTNKGMKYRSRRADNPGMMSYAENRRSPWLKRK